MNEENTVTEEIDHGIYQYTDTDPKRAMSELTVDFQFIASTEMEEAIEVVEKALESSGLNYSIHMWTKPQEN